MSVEPRKIFISGADFKVPKVWTLRANCRDFSRFFSVAWYRSEGGFGYCEIVVGVESSDIEATLRKEVPM